MAAPRRFRNLRSVFVWQYAFPASGLVAVVQPFPSVRARHDPLPLDLSKDARVGGHLRGRIHAGISASFSSQSNVRLFHARGFSNEASLPLNVAWQKSVDLPLNAAQSKEVRSPLNAAP